MNSYENRFEGSESWYDRDTKTLFFTEYESRIVSEDQRHIFEELIAFPDKFELIRMEEIIIDRKRHLSFSSNCRVGVEKNGDYSVFVFPKVKNADFFTMVNYAYDFRIDLKQESTYLNQEYRNLSAIFLKYILLRLQEFLALELKRSFIKREEDLISKIKGKVMLSSYLNNSVAAKKDNIIPCQFYEIQADCLENQIIRYTAEMARKVIPQIVYSLPLRKEMMNTCNWILYRLSNVRFKRINIGDFNRIRYVGRFKNYKFIHELCKLFIQAASLEMMGGKLLFQGFSLDMNDLFEKFVVGVLKKEAGFNIEPQKKGNFYINGFARNIWLDGWIEEARVIFDTKYKEALEAPQHGDAIDLGNVKILNTDIYQILAYCNHQDFHNSIGILIYPVSNLTDEKRQHYVIKGFNQDIIVLFIKLDFNYLQGRALEIIEFANDFKQLLMAQHDTN